MSELEKVARELEAKVNSLREEKRELLEALKMFVDDFKKNYPYIVESGMEEKYELAIKAIKKATE
jgi:hypothetical protein